MTSLHKENKNHVRALKCKYALGRAQVPSQQYALGIADERKRVVDVLKGMKCGVKEIHSCTRCARLNDIIKAIKNV